MSTATITGPRTLNIRRLRSAVNWVEQQSKLPLRKRIWRQATWALDLQHRFNRGIAAKRTECGTTLCVAGYVVDRFGVGQFTTENRRYSGELSLVDSVGGYVNWGDAALSLLGLSREDPAGRRLMRMFHNTNARPADVRRAAEQVAEMCGKTL